MHVSAAGGAWPRMKASFDTSQRRPITGASIRAQKRRMIWRAGIREVNAGLVTAGVGAGRLPLGSRFVTERSAPHARRGLPAVADPGRTCRGATRPARLAAAAAVGRDVAADAHRRCSSLAPRMPATRSKPEAVAGPDPPLRNGPCRARRPLTPRGKRLPPVAAPAVGLFPPQKLGYVSLTGLLQELDGLFNALLAPFFRCLLAIEF